jgi:DNA-binding NarL/FixJ family response regulator
MNLSSKEMAQLLNISLKGVEVARYRLRKKLGIPSAQTSLYDFLTQASGEPIGERGQGSGDHQLDLDV